MKLIIDIEPRYCKDMQSDVKELYYEAINRITEAVRDGTPYEERPQGRWLYHEEYTNNRPFYITECSFCKLRVKEETNFCPNCGADMRKGGAE